jgi:hypothetical protein
MSDRILSTSDSRTARKTPTMIPVTIMWPRSGHLTGLFDGGDRRNPRMF